MNHAIYFLLSYLKHVGFMLYELRPRHKIIEYYLNTILKCPHYQKRQELVLPTLTLNQGVTG